MSLHWKRVGWDTPDPEVMNAFIEQAMASRQSSSFRLIDFFRLGGAMPEEALPPKARSMLFGSAPESYAGSQWPRVPDAEPLGLSDIDSLEVLGPTPPGSWSQVWTVMLNSMCPAELAARGSYAVWEGNLCSGTEAGSLQYESFSPCLSRVHERVFEKGAL